MQLFFSEDGAVQLTLNGTLLPGRWVYDPGSDRITLSLPYDTYTVSFGPEDELLMVFSPEETIVLTREELDTGLLFQPVSASGKEDFSGNWVAVYYALNKGWFSLNGLEEYMAAGLVVADETFSLVVAMDGSALPQYDASFTFTDGKLELLPNNHPSLRIGEVVMTRGGFLLFPFTIAGAGEDSWTYLAFEKDSAN